jgi:hypothetical protein
MVLGQPVVWLEANISQIDAFLIRCPALWVWVTFFKQPDALPGRAPLKKNTTFD